MKVLPSLAAAALLALPGLAAATPVLGPMTLPTLSADAGTTDQASGQGAQDELMMLVGFKSP